MNFTLGRSPVHKLYRRYFKTLSLDPRIIHDHPTFCAGLAKTIELEKVYVPLLLSAPDPVQDPPGEKVSVLDPVSALLHYQHLVILGGFGSGKTTLLNYLTLKLCRINAPQDNPDGLIPIPLLLREFPGKSHSLRSAIDHVFKAYGIPMPKKILERDLASGKCLLLLDGFDELISRDRQAVATREIFAFIDAYPLCRVVITSRPSGYHGEFLGFSRLECQSGARPPISPPFTPGLFPFRIPRYVTCMSPSIQGI